MANNPERRWLSPVPTHCDVCGGAITIQFVDGKTRGGAWGILCIGCHILDGCGLGPGRGQEYHASEANPKVFIKVGG